MLTLEKRKATYWRETFPIMPRSTVTRYITEALLWLFIINLGIAATLIVFFTFTYPANQQTNNWTFLPDNWLELRKRWEYSHATSAGLYFIAVSALIWSAQIRSKRTS